MPSYDAAIERIRSAGGTELTYRVKRWAKSRWGFVLAVDYLDASGTPASENLDWNRDRSVLEEIQGQLESRDGQIGTSDKGAAT